MIRKSQDQRIHIWCHHIGTYYQQPLTQQQILIMGDRLTSCQAFQLKSNLVRWDYRKMPSLRNIKDCSQKRKKIEEKLHTYSRSTCVIMSGSILNGTVERSLSNYRPVKVRSSPELLSMSYNSCATSHPEAPKTFNYSRRNYRCC